LHDTNTQNLFCTSKQQGTSQEPRRSVNGGCVTKEGNSGDFGLLLELHLRFFSPAASTEVASPDDTSLKAQDPRF
jgi:hypothetical protein